MIDILLLHLAAKLLKIRISTGDEVNRLKLIYFTLLPLPQT